MSQIKSIFEPLVNHEETLKEKGVFLGAVLKDFFAYDADKYSNNWNSVEESTDSGYSFYAELAQPFSTYDVGEVSEFKPPMKLELSLLTGGVCVVDMSPCAPLNHDTHDTAELYTSATIHFSTSASEEESAIEILGKLAVSEIDFALQESLSGYISNLKTQAKEQNHSLNGMAGYIKD